MRSEWKEEKLGNVLGPKGYIRGPFGSALKRGELLENGPIPIYEQQHAIYGDRHFRFFIDNTKYEKLKRFTVKEKDIIISCSGTIGRASMIGGSDPKGIISQALLILRVDADAVLPDFLLHFLRSAKGYHAITSRSSGSVQVNIAKREIIENIQLLLPSLPEQKAIAATLTCLDDKIELNNKINANLEAQAQAIFKSWFVDFEPFRDGEFVNSEFGRIPKGWRIGTLDNIAEIIMGQSPNGDSYNEDGTGTVFFQGRGEFGNRYPITRLYTTQPKRLAQQGDILMSVRAPVGDINIAKENCCVGRGLAAIRSKQNHQSFLLYLMFHLKAQLDRFNGEGTVFGSINKKDLHGLPIVIPCEEYIAKYNKAINSIDKKIFLQEMQNLNLAAIRDTLLPKLLSGEIEVPVQEEA